MNIFLLILMLTNPGIAGGVAGIEQAQHTECPTVPPDLSKPVIRN